jgi:hypothetical protein
MPFIYSTQIYIYIYTYIHISFMSYPFMSPVYQYITIVADEIPMCPPCFSMAEPPKRPTVEDGEGRADAAEVVIRPGLEGGQHLGGPHINTLKPWRNGNPTMGGSGNPI